MSSLLLKVTSCPVSSLRSHAKEVAAEFEFFGGCCNGLRVVLALEVTMCV